ncbi:MAG: hypothetical protein M0P12_04325 [Paludibacteraceae bacterium]|nr:hypothetical protein [Paludibacteraceae bacterium]
MLKRIFIFIPTLLMFTSATFAQAVGTWKTYFSYNNINKVVDGGDFVYALSDGFLFSLNKWYENIDTYSKIQGMSDNKISDIAYYKEKKTLLITYSNCNIDFFADGHFYNLPDLKRKSISDKRINSISFHKNCAYLSCGFGIVVINLDKNEILDTYIIGENGSYMNILSTVFIKDSIFALSNTGIIKADLKNTNLANYENWQDMDASFDYSGSIKMTSFANNIVLLKGNGTYRYDGTKWTDFNATYSDFSNAADRLTLYQNQKLISYDSNWNQLDSIESQYPIANLCYSKQGNCYYAACEKEEKIDLNKISLNGSIINSYSPEGPLTCAVAFAKIRGNKIITGSGGPFDLSINTPGLVQIYENGKWSTIKNSDVKKATNDTIELMDVLDAEFDPLDPKRIYVATWRSLFEFYDNKFVKRYTNENSPIEPYDKNLTLVNGLVFDSDNNLWMLNMFAQDLIKVKKADGTWVSLHYSRATSKETARKLFFASNGYKWVLCPPHEAGVEVIYDNKTPFINSDDNNKFFSSFYENSSDGIKQITPTTYRCIAEDKDGVIWIGTNMGPILIKEPEKAFYNDFYIERIKITREDDSKFADYLLANEQINAIVVDGANRKWIGTASNGVFLLSEDGQETIHHFTMENSPLTSNAIMDISLNEKTGEVLLVTSNSIFSYMSDAIEGSESYDDVYVYPNPVPENYDGQIIIKGLIDESVIKIADIKGNVICQGTSRGGIFSWNGQYKNGDKVNSGVYFVFMALSDGSEKAVTKIAVIN